MEFVKGGGINYPTNNVCGLPHEIREEVYLWEPSTARSYKRSIFAPLKF
jgi:hypothetical protein